MGPDVVIQVEYVAGQGEYVNMVFPGQVLTQEQIGGVVTSIATSLGSEYILSNIRPSGEGTQVPGAVFRTYGLLDQNSGGIGFAPLLQGLLAQGNQISVSRVELQVLGLNATNLTLRQYEDEFVTMAGNQNQANGGLYYMISVNTTDPAEIQVPSVFTPSLNASGNTVEPQKDSRDNSVVLVTLIAVAGVSAGALVYFLLLNRT